MKYKNNKMQYLDVEIERCLWLANFITRSGSNRSIPRIIFVDKDRNIIEDLYYSKYFTNKKEEELLYDSINILRKKRLINKLNPGRLVIPIEEQELYLECIDSCSHKLGISSYNKDDFLRDRTITILRYLNEIRVGINHKVSNSTIESLKLAANREYLKKLFDIDLINGRSSRSFYNEFLSLYIKKKDLNYNTESLDFTKANREMVDLLYSKYSGVIDRIVNDLGVLFNDYKTLTLTASDVEKYTDGFDLTEINKCTDNLKYKGFIITGLFYLMYGKSVVVDLSRHSYSNLSGVEILKQYESGVGKLPSTLTFSKTKNIYNDFFTKK